MPQLRPFASMHDGPQLPVPPFGAVEACPQDGPTQRVDECWKCYVQGQYTKAKELPEVRRLGYPEPFVRMWEYDLCYCEGGFLERQIGDVQMLLTKPRCRLPSVL